MVVDVDVGAVLNIADTIDGYAFGGGAICVPGDKVNRPGGMPIDNILGEPCIDCMRLICFACGAAFCCATVVTAVLLLDTGPVPCVALTYEPIVQGSVAQLA